MPSCSFGHCKNSTKKRNPSDGISFFSYPKDERLRRAWVLRCGRDRDDSFNVSAARVCSLHFRNDDFERDLEHELLELPLRQFLKKDAVPSEDLFDSHGEGGDEENRFRKEYIKSLLIGENDGSEKISSIKAEPSSDSETEHAMEFQAVPAVKYEIDLKEEANSDAESDLVHNIDDKDAGANEDVKEDPNSLPECQRLIKQNTELRRLLALKKAEVATSKAQIKLRREKMNSLTAVGEKLRLKKRERYKIFHTILSPPKINAIFQLKKNALPDEDRMNKRCFERIRETLNYPLSGCASAKNVVSEVPREQPSLSRSKEA